MISQASLNNWKGLVKSAPISLDIGLLLVIHKPMFTAFPTVLVFHRTAPCKPTIHDLFNTQLVNAPSTLWPNRRIILVFLFVDIES